MIRGLVRQDLFSIQKLLEGKTHPGQKFCKETKSFQQTGPQPNRSIQIYRSTAELTEGPPNMEMPLCKVTQTIKYLGFIIDVETMTFELPKTGFSTSDCAHSRGLSCNSHCDRSSATALSCAPTAQKQKSCTPPLIRHEGVPGPGESIRSELVDYPSEDQQWKTNSPTSIRPDVPHSLVLGKGLYS